MRRALLLALLGASPPTGGDGAVLRTNFAQVTVLGAWKPPPEQVAREGHGAPAGLCVAILVEPLPRVGGGYLGREPKDAVVAGRSYVGWTRAQLGRTYPAHTATGPPTQFELVRRSPAYVAESPRGPLPVVVVSSCLWGAPLPPAGPGQLTFEVGYFGTTEPVNVTFELAQLDTTPAVRKARPVPVSNPDSWSAGRPEGPSAAP
jgi:hypothetical protein